LHQFVRKFANGVALTGLAKNTEASTDEVESARNCRSKVQVAGSCTKRLATGSRMYEAAPRPSTWCRTARFPPDRERPADQRLPWLTPIRIVLCNSLSHQPRHRRDLSNKRRTIPASTYACHRTRSLRPLNRSAGIAGTSHDKRHPLQYLATCRVELEWSDYVGHIADDT
jgi:hypothetical protein